MTALIAVYFWTRKNTEDIDTLKKSCNECRLKMEQRLEDGSDEFHKTRIDILSTAKDSAIQNAELREEFFKAFVTEQTFKDRVIATMIANCDHCRQGGKS